MAAGLGFKDFTTGEVLTAADVDGYLMQGIWVFADATARDAAVTSPQEGNACYLKDTDVIQVYTGSTWAAQSASNPISGNIVDAKGDLIVATAADTVARLASSGVNNDVLTVDTSTATGLKWAAGVAATNFSLVNAGGTALTGATTVTVSGITSADKILIIVSGASSASASSAISLRLNADTGSNYASRGISIIGGSTYASGNLAPFNTTTTNIPLAEMGATASSVASGYCLLNGCNSAGIKVFNSAGVADTASNPPNRAFILGGTYSGTSVISSVSAVSSVGNFDAGTIFVYTSAI